MDSKFLKPGYELSIVLDISSESIGGSLVVLQPNQTATIIYATRSPIIWEKPAAQEPLLIKIKLALVGVMRQLHNDGLAQVWKQGIYTSRISKVFVTYASPWYLSETEGVTINYEKPTLITRALLKDIVEAEEQKFTARIKNHTHSDLYHNAHIIERRIVDIKLNGYGTDSPYQKKASKIELSMHTSFVSRDILLITNNAVQSYFNCRAIKYFSFPLVAFSAVAEDKTDIHDSLLIDIRGETTDISLIKNGALWESLSFPVGSGALWRDISRKTNTSIHIAQSQLAMYYERKPLPEIVLSLDAILAEYGKVWSMQCRQAIRDITQSASIVKKVTLIVEPRLEKYMTSLLRGSIPDVIITLVHGYDFKESIQGVTKYPDTPLALETYFASLMKK